MLDENETTVGAGGGLLSTDYADLNRVTISNNSASAHSHQWGGGVAAWGDLTLTNVTIYRNTAGDVGGGLALGPGTFGLINVTLYDNSGGLWTGPNTTAQVVNTLFYNWTKANCVLISPLTSFGHNLENANSCGLNGTGDLVNSPPSVAIPGLYGGFGETVPLLVGSAGIDDGDTALAPPTDQNGVLRWDGDGDGTVTADIGAYEYGPFFADAFESGNTSGWSATVP